MKQTEFSHILLAIVALAFVAALEFIIRKQWSSIPMMVLFAIIIILASVFAKKLAAYLLDSDVEHEIWKFQRFGFGQKDHFKKPMPAGLILPIALSVITLGVLKFSAFLTYETKALKYRASKRFGYYSYTEMTDLHNSIIGAAGIVAVLIITLVAYFIPGFEYLSKISAYYAFWNLLPISKLDGTQIFFGSRVLWSVLATISALLILLSVLVY